MVNFSGWQCPSLPTNFNRKIASRQFCFFCCQKKKGPSGQDKIESFKPKRKRVFFVAFLYRLVSSPAENFFPLRWLAPAGRRKALFSFLTKRSKTELFRELMNAYKNINNWWITQGLELMLDTIVKPLFRQHKHPMENRDRTRCLGWWWVESLWGKI